MTSTNTDAGPWKILRVLGSGGFGQVSLWHNSDTGQKIAVKKLHEHVMKDPTVKPKLVERWCNEVEIMKKLNHLNVVATLKIPQELSGGTSLPILAMEYCSNGNLRQVLNKAENCCGLKESEIYTILRDISSGLAYLHSCKIIHRDIKPENIVLQQEDSKIIYKLIDLGYAKALDESSLSKSFVGTIQYIAPELFMGKAYTSSVDYWSFGLLTHEIATGYRPFLPGFSPSDWMKQIQNKSRNIICVRENNNGDIIYDSSISRRNHLSRCFLEEMEKWLQLALDWDGQTRGRDLVTNRLVIFEELTKIIDKRLLTVFSITNFKTLSYEINIETDLSDLRRWLKKDTGLEREDQLLLLPSGESLGQKGNLLKYFLSVAQDWVRFNIFLYDCGVNKIKNDLETMPDFMEELIDRGNNHLTYRLLKRKCADLVYFLQCEATCCSNLLHGIKVKINNTKRTTLAVESLYEDLEDEWRRIENYGQCLSFSHKNDLENYIYHRKSGNLKSSPFVRKWIQNVVDVNNKITELRNSFNQSKQRELVLLAKQRCRNLDHQSTSNDVTQKSPLDELLLMSYQLWENIKKLSKSDEEISAFNASRVHLVRRGVEESRKFFEGQILRSLFSKIAETDDNLLKFFSHLGNILKSAKLLKLLIENIQMERQKEVWSLVINSRSLKNPQGMSNTVVEELQPETVEYENRDSNFFFIHKSSNDHGAFENRDVESRVRKSNNFGPSSESDFDKMPSFQNINDTCSIINDNILLRYRIQEVQQACHQTVKEIGSLSWEVIFET